MQNKSLRGRFAFPAHYLEPGDTVGEMFPPKFHVVPRGVGTGPPSYSPIISAFDLPPPREALDSGSRGALKHTVMCARNVSTFLRFDLGLQSVWSKQESEMANRTPKFAHP